MNLNQRPKVPSLRQRSRVKAPREPALRMLRPMVLRARTKAMQRSLRAMATPRDSIVRQKEASLETLATIKTWLLRTQRLSRKNRTSKTLQTK